MPRSVAALGHRIAARLDEELHLLVAGALFPLREDGLELLGELRHGEALLLGVAVGHAEAAPEVDEPQMVEALGDLQQVLDGGQVVVRREEQRADVHVDAHDGQRRTWRPPA